MIGQVFQDVNGSYSSKRVVFFVFVVLFIVLACLLFFRAVDAQMVPLVQNVQDKTTDIIKWMGGFIASEQITKIKKD